MTRALVAAGADVLSIGEARHSLEDVYLELVDDDGGPEAMSGARPASARLSARSCGSSGATGSSSSRWPSCRSSSCHPDARSSDPGVGLRARVLDKRVDYSLFFR